jgi:hypothetical protein
VTRPAGGTRNSVRVTGSPTVTPRQRERTIMMSIVISISESAPAGRPFAAAAAPPGSPAPRPGRRPGRRPPRRRRSATGRARAKPRSFSEAWAGPGPAAARPETLWQPPTRTRKLPGARPVREVMVAETRRAASDCRRPGSVTVSPGDASFPAESSAAAAAAAIPPGRARWPGSRRLRDW